MDLPGGIINPERAPAVERPEVGFESSEKTVETPETAPARREKTPVGEGAPVAPVFQAMAPAAQFTKDPILKKVEEILEEDMAETYQSLPPELRAKFKQRGEAVAEAVKVMISSAKIQAKKVLRLIVAWLRIIPHVNRFYLEQEAKLKTDLIMALAEKQKGK